MGEVNHSARKHALLSASGASRWLNCTPSARLEENYESTQSSYATEGTLAHEFAEIGVKYLAGQIQKRDYNKQLGIFRTHISYSDEMEEEVQKHVDYVLEQYNEAKRITKDAYLIVEEKFDLTDYIEEGFGTGDDVIIADSVMEIIDLKYGKGIRVSAVENSQLKLYALGALANYEMLFDIKVVRLTIVQPRLDSISSWEISVEDLKDWGENVVKKKAKEAYEGEGEYVAGDWCKFCKAKAKCRAFANKNLAIAKLEFSDLEGTDKVDFPKELSDSEILDVYEKASQFQDWLNSITQHVLQTSLEGKEWEGYKLVEGKSNRKWLDEEKVVEMLKEAGYSDEDIHTTKLKSLTTIEKAIGKANFTSLLSEYVIKPQGAPTLVPISDKRPALGIASAIEDFKD